MEPPQQQQHEVVGWGVATATAVLIHISPPRIHPNIIQLIGNSLSSRKKETFQFFIEAKLISVSHQIKNLTVH
jgi:hypothetical protein